MDKHILLIVEGPNDEETIIKKLWDRFDKNVDYHIVTYETNIHVLLKQLFKDGKMDEELDILRFLRSSNVPENKRIEKGVHFTDIYLIFDFDPHDPESDFELIGEALKFFNDSSDKGKLFINYPMMQSYRHIKCSDDNEFKHRTVPFDIGRKYKSLVDKEAWNPLKQINKLDRGMFKWIIQMHLIKLNYIINGSDAAPTYHEYMKMTGDLLFRYQLSLMEKNGTIFVLNTSLFLIVDYSPSLFFDDTYPENEPPM